MTIARLLQTLLSLISVGMVLRVVQMILGWVDRRTGPRIMQERINSGSDAFFSHEMKHPGGLEIEAIDPPRYRLSLAEMWRRLR
jgi:hypothetical protein